MLNSKLIFIDKIILMLISREKIGYKSYKNFLKLTNQNWYTSEQNDG